MPSGASEVAGKRCSGSILEAYSHQLKKKNIRITRDLFNSPWRFFWYCEERALDRVGHGVVKREVEKEVILEG